ncbi:MAG: glycosyltransferase [Chitinivibrionales bacterium]|nr:glycosyltransferase [Chitinivibrionales bacterium]
MKLSVVIPTFNRSAALRMCLVALTKQKARQELRIIVADDASAHGERRRNRELCRELGVFYCCNDANRGPAAARNIGIAHSAEPWIAFLDDDVCVDETWCGRALHLIQTCPADIVGIEGKIIATGDGLWDREVENLHGNLFLTGNIIYKREALIGSGGFDENFRGPYCEDHGLAADMLLRGRIVFEPALCACHQPRVVKLAKYLMSSVRRARTMLDSEFYLYCKFPDRYHRFRYAHTFWGTYKAFCLKNIYLTFKRRSIQSCLKHPLQCIMLLAIAQVEQITALALAGRYLSAWMRRPNVPFLKNIDIQETARLWKMPSVTHRDFRLLANPLNSLLFPFFKKTPYTYVKTLKRFTRANSKEALPLRIFIRIDDMFLDKNYDYDRFLQCFGANPLPFLSVFTGHDLASKANWPLMKTIGAIGGTVALHGFSHQGKFGPFNSEILQMTLPDLDRACRTVMEGAVPSELKPFVFVPPFNAINRQQILYLSKYFPVICGGPETARFTDNCFGPVALATGATYFPVFQPFCCPARTMLHSGALESLEEVAGYICLSFHFKDELADDFESLMTIFDRVSAQITSWEYLIRR